jgi:hypothetical protein
VADREADLLHHPIVRVAVPIPDKVDAAGRRHHDKALESGDANDRGAVWRAPKELWFIAHCFVLLASSKALPEVFGKQMVWLKLWGFDLFGVQRYL